MALAKHELPKIDHGEAWYARRAGNVGASEVAALFGLCPYMSRWALWHYKKGSVATPDMDGERTYWGNILEQQIAKGIGDKNGWEIQKVHRYLTHKSVKGMGASLDYEIVAHKDGAAPFEIKNVDNLIFLKDWEGEGESLTAPIHIELQLQHQLAVTGRQWGAIGVLVGGNKSYEVIRQRHEPTIAKLEQGVAEFWESIEKGKEPKLENPADLSLISTMYDGKKVINVNDPLFDEMCYHYKRLKASEKKLKDMGAAQKVAIVNYLMERDAVEVHSLTSKATYKMGKPQKYTVEKEASRTLRISNRQGA